MFWFTDWLFILISTYFSYKSYKRIIYNRYASMANFVILIVYVFCCTPILFNYIFGIPEYNTIYWYQSFLVAMYDTKIAIIYSVYMTVSLIALYSYASYHDKYKAQKCYGQNFETNQLFENKVIEVITILSPIVYILISGNLFSFVKYGSNSARGLNDGTFNIVLTMLILLSLYTFCNYIFRKPFTKGSSALLLVYSLLLTWINGKRFLIALMGIIYLYYYTKSNIDLNERKKIAKLFPVFVLLLVLFSYFYLVVIRPLSETGFQSIYEMLRVDFGRDDVIKFVIQKEFFEGIQILDYPGQSFLSTFLTYIPRQIWESKPYPHYMYLTAEILNLDIFSLPAGTTPSWYEMCLANFSYLGYIIGVISMPLICYGADKLKNRSVQLIILIVLIVLLTQSTDVYFIFLLLLLAQFGVRLLTNNRKIIITLSR